MSRVSIIIPTYNRKELLKETLTSLFAQTYSDMEIIVVDDGSTDRTPEMMEDIASRRTGIKYFYRPHYGANSARNFGLKQADGEYIGFFDSDDIWPPDFIAVMVKNLQSKPDFDAAYSRIMHLVNGQIIGNFVEIKNPPIGYITKDFFFRSKPFNLPSSTIFHKRAWENFFWDEALNHCGDYDVFLRLSPRIRFFHVPETFTMYHKTNDSLTAAKIKTLFSYHMYIMERFYFQLGGSKFISKRAAYHKISRLYRSFGLKNYRAGNRKAAILLLLKAISYLPYDLRLYINLLLALLQNPVVDRKAGWQMPSMLGEPINRI